MHDDIWKQINGERERLEIVIEEAQGIINRARADIADARAALDKLPVPKRRKQRKPVPAELPGAMVLFPNGIERAPERDPEHER